MNPGSMNHQGYINRLRSRAVEAAAEACERIDFDSGGIKDGRLQREDLRDDLVVHREGGVDHDRRETDGAPRSDRSADRRPVAAGSVLRRSGLGLGRARVGLADRAAGP